MSGEIKSLEKSIVCPIIDNFGKFLDKSGNVKNVTRFTWKNKNNVSVQLITYGATITSIKIPDNDGVVEDIVLGFDNMEGYINPSNRYFGATIGRCANRIGGAKMTIEGIPYNLAANNNGVNHLHGGLIGFDKVVWDYFVNDSKVVLSYNSKDLEEGYPGDVLVNITFELTNENQFLIDYRANTTKTTVVNLTNHSYFNLAGHDKGANELYEHVIIINADSITDVNEQAIPTGKLLSVADTAFDLRNAKTLGNVILKVPNAPGFDHNFCINNKGKPEKTFVLKATHPGSGRTVELYSNQPGVQFYTSNFLPEEDKLKGKKGVYYKKHAAFCMETQNYPDAVNHKNFPSPLLYPGETYHHSVVFKFDIEN